MGCNVNSFIGFVLFSSLLRFSILRNVLSVESKHPIDLYDLNVVAFTLEKYDTSSSKEQVFTQEVRIFPLSFVTYELKDVPSVVSFLTVQLHSYEYNLTLSSYNQKAVLPEIKFQSVSGANIGLVLNPNGAKTFNVTILNVNDAVVDAMFVAVAYAKAPVPGGCNMEFNVEVAPFQKLKLTESTVIVEAGPASVPPAYLNESSCERHFIQHEAYQMFIGHQDFNKDSYFTSLRMMLTVDDIIKYSKQIPGSISLPPLRRVYSKYPGTGSVYAMVARFGNYSSAYVPIFTYACRPLSAPDSCQILTSTFSKVMCGLMAVVGLMLTFAGYGYFNIFQFFLKILLGGLFAYMIYVAVLPEAGETWATITAIFLLLAWMMLALCFFGISTMYLLSLLTLGFLVACAIFFGLPGGLPVLENDSTYWLYFVIVIILTPFAQQILCVGGEIVSCAVIGSYITIVCIDYFVGTCLKYIIINTLRRAIVTGFNVAIVNPPFQASDVGLAILWITLSMTAMVLKRFSACKATPSLPKNASETTVLDLGTAPNYGTQSTHPDFFKSSYFSEYPRFPIRLPGLPRLYRYE